MTMKYKCYLRILALALLSMWAGTVQAQYRQVIEEHFSVSPGEQLQVEVAHADVMLHTHQSPSVEVVVSMDAEDWEQAEKLLRKLDFQIERTSEGVSIVTRKISNVVGFWDLWRLVFGQRRVGIRVEVTVPEQFSLNVSTSGGDVEVERIRGEAKIRTAGGDITFDRIQSPSWVQIATAGGDIEGVVLRGEEVEVKTAGGDIEIHEVEGENIQIKTAGGDIEIVKWRGNGDAHTAGGDIVVEEVEGDLEAKTMGGDVEVFLKKPGHIVLSTTGGDIDIFMPPMVGAKLYFRGGRVLIASDFTFRGMLEKDEAEGEINGGGEAYIEARTFGGVIRLRSRKAAL